MNWPSARTSRLRPASNPNTATPIATMPSAQRPATTNGLRMRESMRPRTYPDQMNGCSGELRVRLGRAQRRRDDQRGGDHEDERGDLQGDADGVTGHRIAEDDDPAHDRGDVGGRGGGRDDRDGLAVLQAARGGEEGD